MPISKQAYMFHEIMQSFEDGWVRACVCVCVYYVVPETGTDYYVGFPFQRTLCI